MINYNNAGENLKLLSHLLYSVSCPEHQSGDVRYILNILTSVNQTS